MIYSDEHQYVYLAIPKTGSTTVYNWLHRNYGAKTVKGRTILELEGRDEGKHEPFVPKEKEGYYTFTCVRCPYTRAVSEYLFHKTFNPEALYVRKAREMLFEDYVEWAVENSWMFTQSYFLSWAPRVDRVLHLESLRHEIKYLMFTGKTPDELGHAMKGKHPMPWQDHYTERAEKFVTSWAKTDFVWFGYDKSVEDTV